jgi:hypothetical protein
VQSVLIQNVLQSSSLYPTTTQDGIPTSKSELGGDNELGGKSESKDDSNFEAMYYDYWMGI